MARTFVDTNLFFYSLDGRDPAKQKRAIEILAQLAQRGEGRISTQVANELTANIIKKLGQSPADTERLIVGLNDFTLIPTNLETVRRALELMSFARLSFWDASILAAAEAGKMRDFVDRRFAERASCCGGYDQ